MSLYGILILSYPFSHLSLTIVDKRSVIFLDRGQNCLPSLVTPAFPLALNKVLPTRRTKMTTKQTTTAPPATSPPEPATESAPDHVHHGDGHHSHKHKHGDHHMHYHRHHHAGGEKAHTH